MEGGPVGNYRASGGDSDIDLPLRVRVRVLRWERDGGGGEASELGLRVESFTGGVLWTSWCGVPWQGSTAMEKAIHFTVTVHERRNLHFTASLEFLFSSSDICVH
jgi:hypothetical protein